LNNEFPVQLCKSSGLEVCIQTKFTLAEVCGLRVLLFIHLVWNPADRTAVVLFVIARTNQRQSKWLIRSTLSTLNRPKVVHSGPRNQLYTLAIRPNLHICRTQTTYAQVSTIIYQESSKRVLGRINIGNNWRKVSFDTRWCNGSKY